MTRTGAIRSRAAARSPHWSRARRRTSQSPIVPALRVAERVAHLDNVKALLVGAIIVAHALLGYSGLKGAWPYQAVREVRLSGVSDVLLGIVVSVPTLCAMGLFFLISGLVTPASLARKGPRRFARDRLVRLGVPLAVWSLGIWPALIYAAHRAAGERHSYFWQFMHHGPFLEPGPMWFVEVLLIYSLGYAAWRHARGKHGGSLIPGRSAVTQCASDQRRVLVALALGISLATILVRPVFPFLSGQIGQLKLWQWPQYLGMFGLGIACTQHGWLDPVPDRIRRGCVLAVGAAILAGAVIFLAVILVGLRPQVFGARLHWAPAGLAAIEGPIAVGASVWLLATAQRHLDRPGGPRSQALTRSAFAAFVVQGPVLIGLALALRPLSLPAEAKALTVACLGLGGSFGVATALIRHTPLGRIL